MKVLSGLGRNRWVKTFIGAALLALVVWFFGPLLGIGAVHPLESGLWRGIAVAVILVGWLIENLVHALRARKHDKALAEGVAAQAVDPNATASAEEMALLAERLKEALAALRHARLGKRGRYLYQLPWYMFIGPPGAGKTTALVNAGLKFPLADTQPSRQGGPQAVRGVGGTRNCDWWFTDEAVLIDTAGRYTTQDSNSAVDSSAWLGFLRLLKRHRRRQPLNGVLVAISLSDLASLNETERSAHAQAIRKRIRELHDQLGVRIPAYVVFTKADLLAGFMEFFGDLGREEREQVWGATFRLDAGKDEGGAVAAFAAEFDALQARLNDRMLARVQQETDLQRRRLIYSFPQQFASLRDVAVEFLDEVFRPSRLEARPLLRGAYFTSGTQDGTPIDRLLGAMAGQFGLPRQSVTAFSGAGRSFFLARLMREVVFGEAGLVSLDPKVERRQQLVHVGALSAAAALLLVLIGLWTMSWFGNRTVIAATHGAALNYEQQYAELARRGAQDTDLRAVLPALATLRSMPGGYAAREQATPVSLTFGLYQGAKLTAAAIDAYDRALNALLLPRLLARLEAQLQAHLDQPEILYEALKVYLILGRQGPLDRELVEQWIGADIGASFPGEENAETRDALAAHLHALLEFPLRALPLNGPLVAEVRGILTRQPLAEYIYNRMLRTALVLSLPEWTVADNAGPAGGRVFELRDGKPLNSGVAGIFTYDGYHTVFLTLLPRMTKDATEDGWVLGREQKGGVVGSVAEMGRLRRDILSLYLDDYTRRWDALLADVALRPFGNLQQGQDELFLLSAPDSPLRDLLTAIDGQTQLSRPAAGDKAAQQAEAKASSVGKKLGGFASYLARSGLSLEQNEAASIIAGAFGADSSGKPVDPATRVDEHFATLHEFVVGSKGRPAQLEAVIAKLQQVYAGINQAANAPNQGQALLGMVGGGGGAAAALAEAAQGAPKPVADMLQTVSASSSQVTASGASAQLADAWRSKVLPLCQAAFNRYPFVAGSDQDVPLDDFTRLLGAGGLIEQFFDQYLKPLVDTSQLPWRWQAGGNTKLGLSDASLAQFQRASEIRDALFPDGGNRISVKFQMVPTTLDPGLLQVSIDIGGQHDTYAHGPIEPFALQWPGSNGVTLVRLTLTPAGGGAATVLEEKGPWALLRLMDAARVTPSGQPDRFSVSFGSAAGSAGFELDASSVRNPFTLSALRAFRCPAKL
ncbi:MAG: type VI secretion system membrane subunit TssM [Rhodospirillales bacterium]|nr:type VI secretion system membrane subunit TssM [Rhodospirillales bacterium]